RRTCGPIPGSPTCPRPQQPHGRSPANMTRKQRDVLSVEWVKLELIRTAYATRGGLFAAMDPRMVLGWYLMLAIIPWFTHNLTVLAVLFVMGAVAVALARVGPLILALFVFGLIMESVYIFVAAI